MRKNKDGSPDKRFKKKDPLNEPVKIETVNIKVDEVTNHNEFSVDPNIILNQFLELNNIELDFDVISGTIPTKHGIIKLDKPTLTLKASYVKS